MIPLRERRPLAQLAWLLGLTAIYFAVGKFGLSLAFLNKSASPVWPPSGLALAACLLLGPRAWPAIFTGAFFTNLTTAGNIWTSIGIASGNTLEGLLGAWLVKRYANGAYALERSRDVFLFVMLAGMVSTTVSATIGVTTLALGGFAPWEQFRPIWFTWWLGDATGAVVVGPILILWLRNHRPRLTALRWLEAFFLLCALVLAGMVVFGGLFPSDIKTYPLEIICLPLLVWAAFRFDPREASTAAVVLSAVAIWGTLKGFGPFAGRFPNEALLLLQLYMGAVTVTALAMAALVAERKRTEAVLQKAHEAAVELSQLKSSFMANVSHEIRTPLNAITGLTDLLLNTKLTDKQKEFSQILRTSSDSLLVVVNDILDFSKIEAGGMKLDRQEFELPAVIKETISLFQPRIEAKNLQLSLTLAADVPSHLYGDAGRLRQILMNLIANAVKFTEQGEISVRVVRDNEWIDQIALLFSVQDTGIGIPSDKQADLFRPFKQVDPSYTRRYGGTGLGLAICRGLVELMGGEIGFESHPGQGSTFWCRVPFSKMAGKASKNTAETAVFRQKTN